MVDSILIILPWSPELPGGVSVVVRNLARVWRENGISTTIVVSDWNSKRASSEKKGFIKFRLALTGLLSIGGLTKSLLLAPVTLFRTLTMLRQRKITKVCFHYATLDSLGIAFLKRIKLYNGQLILCFHGSDVRMAKNRIEAALWRFVFVSVDAITACSNSLAQSVECNFGLATGVVATVYNGVDVDTFTPAMINGVKPMLDFAPNRTYIVSIGSFVELKGHSFLINAFAIIADLFPTLDLIVIGMDGDQRANSEAQVRLLRLDERVRFFVNLRTDQVAAFLVGATVCVQPSITESFGMAVIEAGACGVCVAASEVGGHVEIIAHERTGFLFKPNDAEAIARTLVNIFSDDSRRNAIANALREKVVSTYTWKACAEKYFSVNTQHSTATNSTEKPNVRSSV